MNKKNKHIRSEVNPPAAKQTSLTQLDLLNLGYILGEECQVKKENYLFHISEVLDEDNRQAGFSVSRLPEQQDWHVLPYPYSEYRPKKKFFNAK